MQTRLSSAFDLPKFSNIQSFQNVPTIQSRAFPQDHPPISFYKATKYKPALQTNNLI